MKTLITAQRTFFNTQATKDISFRIKQLDTLQALLKNNENLLYEAIYNDFKKSEFDTYTTELSLVYQDIKEAKRNLSNWAKKEQRTSNLTNWPSKSYVIKEPLGVCLVIGAWNYPFQLSLCPAIAAIAAGNTVIIKPSELPQHTSRVMATLINDSFDSQILTVVEGGVPETTALLAQKFDKIFFTGSTKVGKIVYEAAAKNLTPVTLELGGKSPAIIAADCNLKMTVKRLVWAKFLNAGQTCIAPDYVLVDEKIKEEFLAALTAEIKKEEFSFANNNYVQIINDENVARLAALMIPENTLYGGSINLETRFIEPTVLHPASFKDASMQEEIFGPILPVLSFEHLDEAIAKVRTLPRPLAAYVFTRSSKTKNRVLHSLSFGGGMINDAVMHITNTHLPFGGVGMSGIGAYHGEDGFHCFSHSKGIVERGTWFELPLKYSPRSSAKLKWIKRLMKLQ